MKKRKDVLREVMKTRLAAISPETQNAWSRTLCERLRLLPEIQSACRIMAFLNMPDEVSLDMFVETAIGEGKEIYVPFCLPARAMEPVRLYSLAEAVCGAYGIRTAPYANPRITPAALDCILVPGLAFDTSGHRLGRGSGYYDRFLPQCRNACMIAVSWDIQIQEAVPADSYDIRMEKILSERQYIIPTRYPKGGSIVADT